MSIRCVCPVCKNTSIVYSISQSQYEEIECYNCHFFIKNAIDRFHFINFYFLQLESINTVLYNYYFNTLKEKKINIL